VTAEGGRGEVVGPDHIIDERKKVLSLLAALRLNAIISSRIQHNSRENTLKML
jgi:hypothetical protein